MRFANLTMRGLTSVWTVLAMLVCVLGVFYGCHLSEEGKEHAQFVAKSTASAAVTETDPARKPGLFVVAESAEQVSREAGVPASPMTAVDFTQDTRNQQAVLDAQQKVAEYKKKLDDHERLMGWLKMGLYALIAALGAKGAILLKVISAGSKLKELVGAKQKQVLSLVEATQESIAQAKTNPLSPDMLKRIQRQYQEMHGTWSGLKDLVHETKVAWEAGQPSA